MEEIKLKMSDLIKQLNDATKAYDEGHPFMTDEEWDNLYFILQQTENQTGVILPDSPTQTIYYEVRNELPKVEHNHKMLSLDKTKSLEVVNAYIKEQPCIVMCKMDGLTCSLHYKDGKLVSAETRGNGLVGEDITHNIKVLPNVPNRIALKTDLVIDGEIICDYDNFKNFSEVFKNPRNFAAGSIRLLDSRECRNRNLTFVAWEVIQGIDELELLSDKLKYLQNLGFTIVPFVTYQGIFQDDIVDLVKRLGDGYRYPIDGIVFKFDNIAYGKMQGETTHHFKNAIAYKFYDESVETKLINIEWGMGRTGVLTPVAIFEPVELEGSTVERASLHNVSIMKETLGKMPWVGQKIRVFKANMIIPQIEWAEEDDETTKNYIDYPKICPVCGKPAKMVLSDNGIINMICTNPNCEGKLINRLDHFCGKKGLDIKGLSKATLEKLIAWGWINELSDIFKLDFHKEEWIKQPGFGEKSVNKILDAIYEARHWNEVDFISAIGIPMIGQTLAKKLVKHLKNPNNYYAEFRQLIKDGFDFSEWEGFGPEKHSAIMNFDYTEADEASKFVLLNEENSVEVEAADKLKNMTFVITGKLHHFKNRDELIHKIELNGGTVSSSVSSKTSYLINNDANSTSSKNMTAKKLGISIISEEKLMEMIDF